MCSEVGNSWYTEAVPKSVNAAFSDFIHDSINLGHSQVQKARASRDWLLDQIHAFPNVRSDFPRLCPDFDIQFGSFARKTKIRPLDDIDLMIGLHAENGTYFGHGHSIQIHVREAADTLRPLCDPNTRELNSRKVVNCFVEQLKMIPQYEHAEIKRNLEAATLKLKSYDWNFDVVPCFFTVPDSSGRTYYLIPDGTGRWKMTDPRMDRDRVQAVNGQHGGYVLPAVRITKYWNRHRRIPTLYSYLLENLLIDGYEQWTGGASSLVDLEFARCLSFICDRILSAVPDPKRLQGDLNAMSREDRYTVLERAHDDLRTAMEAMELEKQGDHSAAIRTWHQIFGTEFPTYDE